MGHADPRRAGLSARGVRLVRGGRVVLDGACLTVAPGTVTAVVARSGAGKSTLLRCLNRLVEPDAGTVELNGQDIRELDPRALRRQVGLVAQTATMLPGTVRDNVGYGLAGAVRGAGDDTGTGAGVGADVRLDETVAAALEAAGLAASLADRTASELSGGERARVALARAFARDPRFVLLDEPTSALDATTAAEVGATLRRLAADGIGVALAVHDLPFARSVADRVVGLDDRPVGDEAGADVTGGSPGSPPAANADQIGHGRGSSDGRRPGVRAPADEITGPARA